MSLFGTQSTFGQPTTASSSIFGAATAQPTTNFFLPQQQQTQTQNPLSFGTSTSASMFGQQAQQPLFGTAPATTSTFNFGGPATGTTFGTAAPGSTGGGLFGGQPSTGFLSAAPLQTTQRPPTQGECVKILNAFLQ